MSNKDISEEFMSGHVYSSNNYIRGTDLSISSLFLQAGKEFKSVWNSEEGNRIIERLIELL